MDGRTDVYVDHACVAMTYYLDYYTDRGKDSGGFCPRARFGATCYTRLFFSVKSTDAPPLASVLSVCVI